MEAQKFLSIPTLKLTHKGMETVEILVNTSVMPIEEIDKMIEFIKFMLFLSTEDVDMDKVRLN